jgi:ubiquinone/menaquinone biosynthesis C-methylase UbiE
MLASDRDQARSFDRVAGAYRRARPSYPAAAVEWALEAAPGRRVVDLAAGTGKLTEVLVAAGADVVAVEPLANMRAELERALPSVRALDGTAERIPLPGGSADAVLVGQAFHWFDAPAALAEIARVLVPGGTLGLVWNMRDDRVPWVAELTRVMLGAGDVLTGSEGIAPPFASTLFSAGERREFPNPTEFDRGRLREWASSTSRIAVLPETERERVLDEVVRLADEHPALADRRTFDMPFVAVVVRARRRQAPRPSRSTERT